MIVACLKWTSVEGDDDRFTGVSPADQTALEVALQLGEAFGIEVVALSAGPVGAEAVLRDALACGAERARRLDVSRLSESRDVGAALADAVSDARVVVCGDHSLDRGSGSVPAYVAHGLGAAQALGLVSLDLTASSPSALRGVRRLDGGRREIVSVPTPCVISVEHSVASLRRASLRRAMAADTARIWVDGPSRAGADRPAVAGQITPFRPRARVLPAPVGAEALDRVRQLTDAGSAPSRGETVYLPPREAAERIVATLRQWGYLA
jgi:electron transfer flavoprotein beta subunit